MPASARFALREATGAVHERLHRIPAFASLAAGRLDRAGYAALLRRLLGFHDPVEAALTAPLAARLAPWTWQRAHLLRADLAAVGFAGPDRALPRIVPPARLGEAAALGSLYVIEGSTLGGRHLARQLDAVLGTGTAAGRSFLQAGGTAGRLRWGAFCAELDAVGADPACLAAMIDAANDTFALYELWFTKFWPNSVAISRCADIV